MRARAPGSTSNIGPGFDVLGLALALYVEVEVRPSDRLVVRSSGEGSELATDATHLAARVATSVAGTDALEIVVHSEIPLGRGLGSSAALAAAAAAAAGALDPLGTAAFADGHAENAAASVLGGLVAATFVDGAVVARGLRLDPGLSFVAVVPDRELATKTARGVLPTAVAFADAVFNLGRMGILLAGLADRGGLVPAAGADRLHQDARTTLYPEAPAILAALEAAGASVACWSGAGPTLLGICDGAERAALVAEAASAALQRAAVAGKVLVLEADTVGLVVSDD